MHFPAHLFTPLRLVYYIWHLLSLSKIPLYHVPSLINNEDAMVCPSVHGDNPRAVVSRLLPVQRKIHGITIY